MKLILGASGFIGKNLYISLAIQSNNLVKGTYCSKTISGAEKNGIYFDLSNPDFSSILGLKNLTHIFLCHGITNIDQCKVDDLAYKINVTNTINLLDNFVSTNVIPIYLSTDMVYSINQSDFVETDLTVPVTEYGKQKVEVENYIRRNFENYIILRLSKVYGVLKGDGTLFTSWLDSLMKQEPIYSASDMFISPIYVMDVVHALERLVVGKHYGIFNLGGMETATRYEFSQRLAKYFKFDLSLIKEKSIKDFRFIEPRPLNVRLNCSKIREAIGIKLMSVMDCFELINKERRIKR